MKTPRAIEQFIEAFSKLPSIGPRQATRLAFYLINLGKAEIKHLSSALGSLQNVDVCKQCFFISESKSNSKGLCDICSDLGRKPGTIMIVEKETDLLSVEKTSKFNGRYMIIGDLNRNGSVDASQRLRISALKKQIQDDLSGSASEIIIGLNPTTIGDLTASIIKQELSSHSKKITRLGRGLPTGGEIEFADEETLGSALDRRN